jgi:uncharacterized damage-inducible protein DinB
MDPASLQPMYRFNTWANEGIRDGLRRADGEALRRPLDLWFGSAFAIAAHLVAGEAIWLARLRDGVSPPRLQTADDFASAGELIEAWRSFDEQWES